MFGSGSSASANVALAQTGPLMKFQHGGYIGEKVIGIGTRSRQSYQFDPNEWIIPHGKMAAGTNKTNVYVQNYTGQNVDVRESIGPDNMRDVFIMIGNDIRNRGPISQAGEQVYGWRRTGRTV